MTWTLAGNAVGDLEYAYDADGRVIQKTGSFARTGLPQAVTGNTFNAANEMTSFNGTPQTYDANGNLVNDGTNTYSWNARNHLCAKDRHICGNECDQELTIFTYSISGIGGANNPSGWLAGLLFSHHHPDPGP
jgi:hypothetical protein